MPLALLDVSVTLNPVQNEVDPLAVMVGAGVMPTFNVATLENKVPEHPVASILYLNEFIVVGGAVMLRVVVVAFKYTPTLAISVNMVPLSVLNCHL